MMSTNTKSLKTNDEISGMEMDEVNSRFETNTDYSNIGVNQSRNHLTCSSSDAKFLKPHKKM